MKNVIRKLTSLCLCAVVYLSCFTTYANAYGDMNFVYVTPVMQATNTWCWAACAEMCGKTVARESTRTQYDVVDYLTEVRGYAPTGNGFDALDGCNYVAMNKKDFMYYRFKTDDLAIWAAKNEAIVALCVDVDGDDLPGHALLMNGTLFQDGSSGSTLTVYFIDPADGSQHNCLCEDFCDGSGNDGWIPILMIHTA